MVDGIGLHFCWKNMHCYAWLWWHGIVAGSERYVYGVLATVALELLEVLCYCLARLLFGREP